MGNKKNIAVFGATGKLGSKFVNLALDDGYKLRLLVRNKSKLADAEHPDITVLIGDATKSDDVDKTVTSADVVVSCLGNVHKIQIMEKAHSNILNSAARQKNIPRCILISSIGCGGTSWLIKSMLIMIGGKSGFNDYEASDKRIREELSVPHVLVRPYALTDKPGIGKYAIIKGRSGTFCKAISRSDVALFFLHCIEDTQWDKSSGIMLGGIKK